MIDSLSVPYIIWQHMAKEYIKYLSVKPVWLSYILDCSLNTRIPLSCQSCCTVIVHMLVAHKKALYSHRTSLMPWSHSPSLSLFCCYFTAGVSNLFLQLNLCDLNYILEVLPEILSYCSQNYLCINAMIFTICLHVILLDPENLFIRSWKYIF